MTDKQPEALIRADELAAIGAESSLARAMAVHTIRLQYKENARLHEVNAELEKRIEEAIEDMRDMLTAIRIAGLTLIETSNGVTLVKLGEVKATGENND